MKKRLISALLILLLSLTARTLAQDAAPADNDTRETAARLSMGAQVEAALAEARSGVRDSDWYLLTLSEPGGLSLCLRHDYLDTDEACCTLRLYPLNGSAPLWERTVAGNRVENRFSAVYPGKGEYALQIASAQDARLPYRLETAFTAAAATEREPNGTPDHATKIALNKAVVGSLAMEDDVDIYAFTLGQPAAVRVSLRHEYVDVDGACCRLTLGQGPNADTVYAADIPGRSGEWASAEIFLDAGSYTLRVDPAEGTDAAYTLEVSGGGEAGVEREGNDAFAEATPIQTNVVTRGSLTRVEDVDIYRFELDAPSEVILAHAHEYQDTDEALFVAELFDDRLNGAWAEYRLSGRDCAYTGDALYLPAGTYYLRYRAGAWTDAPYRFMVASAPMEGIEIERNDTYAQATALAPNTACSGALSRQTDEDYFALTLEETSAVRIGFVFEYLDADEACFDLSVDLAPGNTYWRARLTGRDNLFLSDELILPAGTCYLHLKPGEWTSRPYTMQVAVAPCGQGEAERNDTFATASPIELAKPVRGVLAGAEDVDCYRLEIGETVQIRLSFEHEWVDDADVCYWVEFYRTPAGSGRMAKLQVLGQDGRLESNAVTLKPGTYYVRIYSEQLLTAPYQLSIAE